jgi:hypothetical protein
VKAPRSDDPKDDQQPDGAIPPDHPVAPGAFFDPWEEPLEPDIVEPRGALGVDDDDEDEDEDEDEPD